MALNYISKSVLRSLRSRLARNHSLQRRASIRLSRQYPPSNQLIDQTLVFNLEGSLLRDSSPFPYFMLVAIEAGGFLRALLLLFLYPILACLSTELAVRAMVMVCFLGIRKEGFRAGRAVLPKFLLEAVGLEGFEVMRRANKRVCVTAWPTVMVEAFLKEYLEVEVVKGRELKVCCGFYTGLMEDSNVNDELGFVDGVGENVNVGFGSYPASSLMRHCFSYCKDVYMVSEAEKRNWHILPRDKYPNPLVFHDGRLAFLPTPAAALAMFMWLPIGIPLAVFRSLVHILLPYNISLPIGALTGMKTRVIDNNNNNNVTPSTGSHLYVCNHRTLLDPIYVSVAVNRPVTAVTYSVSRLSEVLSPIRTARLSRNKEEDRRRMGRLLARGDLVVCPEGTTCREPYLLRFSPLFAELADEVIPVALVSRVAMFYGTTASGFKSMDPFFFLMNPRPEYDVELLERIPTAGSRSSIETANHVQSEIGRSLGFECTALTRKDKYMILAGNEGVVDANKPKRQ